MRVAEWEPGGGGWSWSGHPGSETLPRLIHQHSQLRLVGGGAEDVLQLGGSRSEQAHWQQHDQGDEGCDQEPTHCALLVGEPQRLGRWCVMKRVDVVTYFLCAHTTSTTPAATCITHTHAHKTTTSSPPNSLHQDQVQGKPEGAAMGVVAGSVGIAGQQQQQQPKVVTE